MNRLESLTAWFCTTLGITLLGVSVLVVPEKLFADSGSNCTTACCQGCFGTNTCNSSDPCFMNCAYTCNACQSSCQGNPTCLAACLVAAGKTQCPYDPVTGDCKLKGKTCTLPNTPAFCEKPGSTCSCEPP